MPLNGRLRIKYEKIASGRWYAGTFSDFGLRRRLSGEAQELMIQKFMQLKDVEDCPTTFIGTSNVFLAKKYDLTPVGTMAHEWICVLDRETTSTIRPIPTGMPWTHGCASTAY